MIDTSAIRNLSYGLYVLASREGEKDAGCIINTAVQLTSTPLCLSVTVNKQNYTHDIICCSKAFTLSVIDESADFELFKRFGFQSSRDVDKFGGMVTPRVGNGLPYVNEHTNAMFSCKVKSMVDCGTHTLFIAEVTEAQTLSKVPSATYAYYFANIKPATPKREKKEEKKSGWVCKICGYVYEGEELPEDFVCPLCKHGAEDFEKLS